MSYKLDEPLTAHAYDKPSDRLHPTNDVKVMIYTDDSQMVYTYTGSGFHNVTEAIDAAYADSGLKQDIRDYTFRVTDLSTETTARYRMNAHGNLHLIV